MITYKNMDMVFDYQKFRNDIAAFKQAYRLKYTEIDALAGVGSGCTSNIASGITNSKMNTWLAIANAMDIDVRTYFILKTSA